MVLWLCSSHLMYFVAFLCLRLLFKCICALCASVLTIPLALYMPVEDESVHWDSLWKSRLYKTFCCSWDSNRSTCVHSYSISRWRMIKSDFGEQPYSSYRFLSSQINRKACFLHWPCSCEPWDIAHFKSMHLQEYQMNAFVMKCGKNWDAQTSEMKTATPKRDYPATHLPRRHLHQVSKENCSFLLGLGTL